MTRFRTILADPPWDHQCWADTGKLKHPGKHYLAGKDGKNVMSIEEICALPVQDIVQKDATLLLWATAPHLEKAMSVIRAFGFRYVSFVPWIKMKRDTAPKRGIGYHSMSCCEPLLIGKRGKGCPVKRGDLGVIFHPSGPHSAKPDDQYEWAENYEPPYLEMFARPDGALFPPRSNWTFVGNEIDGLDMTDALRLLEETEP